MPHRVVVTQRRFSLRSRREEAALDELARRARSQVVLVDDDGEVRRALAFALRRDGHHVIEACSGGEALEILGSLLLEGGAARRPTLVISKVRLPHFSGLEILEAVRLTTGRIPVILTQALGDEATHEAARALGAARVIDEGADVDALRGAVQSALPA
jgi:CheY-like chemotaxis protein